VILIDALDQLSDADSGRELLWLPVALPAHVRLVVSTTDVEARSLTYRTTRQHVVVSTFGSADAGELLTRWLDDAGRTLPPHQREEVLTRHEQVGLPLYLKLAFEETRLWRSYNAPSATVLAGSIPDLIEDNLLARLEDEANHGKFFVTRALGLLAAAKEGLTEDELIELLSADDVIADFHDRFRRSPSVNGLPVVVWSRLYFDLAPYLAERGADGTLVLNFFHRQLAETVRKRYAALDEIRHHNLAEYFAGKLHLRALTELPYQQTSAQMWDELVETLTDFDFLEAKCATGAITVVGSDQVARTTYSGVYRLLEDFAFAQEGIPGGQQWRIGRAPVYVTPVDLGEGYVMPCPHCGNCPAFENQFLGKTVTCQGPGCGRALRINSFVVQRPEWSNK
jgi:hypothetical protein